MIKINKGYGKNIPPNKEHVLIWFLQKDKSEKSAIHFFNFYKARGWRSQKGEILRDWKMLAWEWTWKHTDSS